MASTVYHLAMRDEMFPRKPPAAAPDIIIPEPDITIPEPDIISIPEKELARLTGLYVDPTYIQRQLRFYLEDGKFLYRAGPHED